MSNQCLAIKVSVGTGFRLHLLLCISGAVFQVGILDSAFNQIYLIFTVTWPLHKAADIGVGNPSLKSHI